jgi:hypothetical protein
VQNLQRYLAVGCVHCIGDDAVLGNLPRKRQLQRARLEAAAEVRGDSARDHQADAATRPRRVERGQLLETLCRFFEPGMHRAHQRAILQRGETEIERGEKMRIGGHGYAGWREADHATKVVSVVRSGVLL